MLKVHFKYFTYLSVAFIITNEPNIYRKNKLTLTLRVMVSVASLQVAAHP